MTDVRYNSSERARISLHGPLTIQHTQTQETKFNALSGIRTRDPGNRDSAIPRLRRHGHGDPLLFKLHVIIYRVKIGDYKTIIF